MQPAFFRLQPVLATLLPLVAFALVATTAHAQRERISLDQDWAFALGHATDKDLDFGHAKGYFSYLAKTGFGDGPAHPSFDDRGWRRLDLPHDWAAEAGFSPDASYSHGFKAIGPGFPASSVGWYRRSFHIPESDLGRRIRIEFDGVFRDAAVFVNGFFVGQEPSGFISASYDITEYLNFGGENTIAVRADASMEEGWYYEGAGIYRHVYLLKTDPLHVARYGTFVTTTQYPGNAQVTVATTIENESLSTRSYRRLQRLYGPDGQLVAESRSKPASLAPGASAESSETLRVKNPQLWDLDSPHRYRLVTDIETADGKLADRYETLFGIRDIRFDPNKGFFLNGRHVKLKGTNNHQNHAGVGTAIPDALQDWRIRQLKSMGSNAYRAAHHPASPALLEACDRLGMLVINENRLMGINDYHLGQLESMIRRDRNHPSIILWSIGNEEWGIEGNIKGARITTLMQAFAQRLDPTRRIVAAVSGGWGGISTAIEVFGVNYIRHGDTDKQHREFPQQIIVGTEETTTQATRGIYVEDASLAHQPPREDGSSGGNAESGWRHYAERDYAAGIYYWTGFDYRGEPTPYTGPAVLSQFGIHDSCGFPKDSYHDLKSWWTDEPTLHIVPHWNWAGREGQPIEVRAHSNCDEVELFLNGTSLGRQSMPRNDHLAWTVPYQPGELLAQGYKNGQPTLVTRVATTGAPAAIELNPDRPAIAHDRRDLAVVTVAIKDAAGRIVPTADTLVHFSLSGPGRIIGVGNGNPSSHEPDQFHGSVSVERLGPWSAPNAADRSTPVRFEATFDLPDGLDPARAQLLLSALGDNQTVTLNGAILYQNATPADARRAIPIAELTLKPAGNTLRIDATPYEDWGKRDSIAQLHPAAQRNETPAPPYQRRAFNGLAQVIVQSLDAPGTITLTATAESLPTTTLQIAESN